jgi:hypothetical protein
MGAASAVLSWRRMKGVKQAKQDTDCISRRRFWWNQGHTAVHSVVLHLAWMEKYFSTPKFVADYQTVLKALDIQEGIVRNTRSVRGLYLRLQGGPDDTRSIFWENL